MSAAIGAMRAVTIAAVQGPCVGGGFVLALSCDLRVVADDAWFSLPEAELGIPLAWSGVPRLVREVGAARTIELVLTCRRVAASEANTLGLLNQVVPRPELESTVAELAATLLARRPSVVTTTKAQLRTRPTPWCPPTGTGPEPTTWSMCCAPPRRVPPLKAAGQNASNPA